MIEVQLDNIGKTYGKNNRILENINLNIQTGEFIVVIGPSGCGKSTLLRMIAGLEEITFGKLWIEGQLMNSVPPSERKIAMVFQDYALYPHMTVFGNISFGLKFQKISASEIQNRVDQAAKMLSLFDLLNRKPSELSGGQRQRVAIARALVKHPKVFLFDEPLSNLDVQLRGQTRIEIASLHRTIGSTTVYVTHDQTEAMTLADRIILLHQGQIQQVGSPLELYHRPANQFVASFIGSPEMSFLKGNLEGNSDQKRFSFEGGYLDLHSATAPSKNGAYTLGIRPESLQLIDQNLKKAGTAITLRITHIEKLGYEFHFIGVIGKFQMIARISESNSHFVQLRQIQVGQFLSFSVLQENIHWFDTTGSRIDCQSKA